MVTNPGQPPKALPYTAHTLLCYQHACSAVTENTSACFLQCICGKAIALGCRLGKGGQGGAADGMGRLDSMKSHTSKLGGATKGVGRLELLHHARGGCSGGQGVWVCLLMALLLRGRLDSAQPALFSQISVLVFSNSSLLATGSTCASHTRSDNDHTTVNESFHS